MLRLFLARHGLTEENRRGVIQGHRPGTLSEEGKRWAEEAGGRLRSAGIEAVYSSDLARAVETASLMARPLGVPVTPTPLLRERGYGELEGRSKAEVGLGYGDIYGAEMADRGVEPLDSVLRRLERFLEMALRGPPCALAVAHGGTNSYLTNLLLKEGLVMRPASDEISCFVLNGGAVEYTPSWLSGR